MLAETIESGKRFIWQFLPQRPARAPVGNATNCGIKSCSSICDQSPRLVGRRREQAVPAKSQGRGAVHLRYRFARRFRVVQFDKRGY